MDQLKKINVNGIIYHLTPSKDATFVGISEDTISPASWKYIERLESGETNGSIFTKISNVFSNMRWLFNKLGQVDFSDIGVNTITGALAELQKKKASLSHTHGVSDLPISSNQVNSSEYIPTSSLVYSMNDILNKNILKTCTETLKVSSSGTITTNYNYPISFGCRDYSSDIWFVQTGDKTFKCYTYSSSWIGGSTISTVSSGTSISVSYLYCPSLQ